MANNNPNKKPPHKLSLVGGPTKTLNFSINLDEDLANEALKHCGGDPEMFDAWDNRRKIQYLAPVLWKQLKRHLDWRPKEQR